MRRTVRFRSHPGPLRCSVQRTGRGVFLFALLALLLFLIALRRDGDHYRSVCRLQPFLLMTIAPAERLRIV